MTNKEEKYRIAAFFDLDLTITDRDSFRYFLEVYYLSKLTKWVYMATWDIYIPNDYFGDNRGPLGTKSYHKWP